MGAGEGAGGSTRTARGGGSVAEYPAITKKGNVIHENSIGHNTNFGRDAESH